MGRPRADAHSVPTNERILNAAERIFSENGYPSARLADIAADAKIRRPSLLYHFESKEVLYEAMVQRLFHRLMERLSGLMAPTEDPEDQIIQVGLAFQAFAESNPAFGRIVMRDIVDHRDPVPQLLASGVIPVLDAVCTYIEGILPADSSRPPVHVRASVLYFCTNTLMQTSSGPLREPLWGPGNHTEDLLKRLFF